MKVHRNDNLKFANHSVNEAIEMNQFWKHNFKKRDKERTMNTKLIAWLHCVESFCCNRVAFQSTHFYNEIINSANNNR